MDADDGFGTEGPQCQHCGRPLDVSDEAQRLVESGDVSGLTCDGCHGLEPLTGALRETLPECDDSDCDDRGPFTIETDAGPVHRCRRHLRRDLKNGMWQFYQPEESA